MKPKTINFVKIKHPEPILPKLMTVKSMDIYYRHLFVFHSLTVIESAMEEIVTKKMEAHDIAKMIMLETKRDRLIKTSKKIQAE